MDVIDVLLVVFLVSGSLFFLAGVALVGAVMWGM